MAILLAGRNTHGTRDCSLRFQDGLTWCLGYAPKIFVASDNIIKTEFFNEDMESKRMFDIEPFHVDRQNPLSMHDAKKAHLDAWAKHKTLVDVTCLVYSQSGIGSQPHCGCSV